MCDASRDVHVRISLLKLYSTSRIDNVQEDIDDVDGSCGTVYIMAARSANPKLSCAPSSPSGCPSDVAPSTLSAIRFPTVERASSPTVSPTAKKYKAALSTEAKTRRLTKSASGSALEIPRTPTRSRPTTPINPGSPRTPLRSLSQCEDLYMESEMDVSRIDPEQALVDAENVDVDLSFELDERELRSLQYGQEDKVHVTVRCVWSKYCESHLIVLQSTPNGGDTGLVGRTVG